jgi:hypothetical protein
VVTELFPSNGWCLSSVDTAVIAQWIYTYMSQYCGNYTHHLEGSVFRRTVCHEDVWGSGGTAPHTRVLNLGTRVLRRRYACLRAPQGRVLGRPTRGASVEPKFAAGACNRHRRRQDSSLLEGGLVVTAVGETCPGFPVPRYSQAGTSGFIMS